MFSVLTANGGKLKPTYFIEFSVYLIFFNALLVRKENFLYNIEWIQMSTAVHWEI
jgi:hypothetical protein